MTAFFKSVDGAGTKSQTEAPKYAYLCLRLNPYMDSDKIPDSIKNALKDPKDFESTIKEKEATNIDDATNYALFAAVYHGPDALRLYADFSEKTLKSFVKNDPYTPIEMSAFTTLILVYIGQKLETDPKQKSFWDEKINSIASLANLDDSHKKAAEDEAKTEIPLQTTPPQLSN